MLQFLFNRLSRDKQKAFALYALDVLLKSKDSSIDQQTAIKLIETIASSKGNKITAFLMKEA